jgi:hypothetical protein
MLSELDYNHIRSTDNLDKAIHILFDLDQFHTVILYESTPAKLNHLIQGLVSEIKRRNQDIQDINSQWLPTNPHHWDDIYDWDNKHKPVKCAEISINTFEKNAPCISMTGWMYDALTDSTARKPISSRAMATLAAIGYLILRNSEEDKS